MRNPPEALKVFAENTKVDSKVAMPTYTGSNTQYLSIPYLQFNLRGQGNYREMFINPPLLQFKESLFINKQYTQHIIMKKAKRDSQGTTADDSASTQYKKSIRVEGKSDESFIVEINSDKFDNSTSSEDDIDIEVTIHSKTCGLKTAYLMIDIEDGVPLSYFIQAEFEGPTVSIVESSVEFGLQKVNSQTSFTINVTNDSPVDAPVFIKNANGFMNLSFDECLKEYQNEMKNEHNSRSDDKKENICVIDTLEKNQIMFHPQCLIIPANTRGDITVTLH